MINFFDFDSALMDRFCLTLLHSIWQVALLALIAWCVDRFWFRQITTTASTALQRKYSINVVALLLGLAALPVTYTLIEVGENPNSNQMVTTNVAESVHYHVDSAPGSRLPDAAIENAVTTQARPEFETLPAAQPSHVANTKPSSVQWSWVAPWIFGLYVTGVLLMLVRLSWSIIKANRIVSCAELVTTGPLVDLLQRLTQKWSVNIMPGVAKAEKIVVPKVAGFVRPTILLPASALTGLSPDQLEMILAHEIAHVQRHDMWINLIQRLAEAALFFNPALWFLSRRISILREFCCDELACQSMEPKTSELTDQLRTRYALALLRVVELTHEKTPSSQLAGLAVSGRSPSELRRRLARLLGEPLREPIRLSTGSLLVGVIALLVLVGPTVWHAHAKPLAHQDEKIKSPAEIELPTDNGQSINEAVHSYMRKCKPVVVYANHPSDRAGSGVNIQLVIFTDGTVIANSYAARQYASHDRLADDELSVLMNFITKSQGFVERHRDPRSFFMHANMEGKDVLTAEKIVFNAWDHDSKSIEMTHDESSFFVTKEFPGYPSGHPPLPDSFDLVVRRLEQIKARAELGGLQAVEGYLALANVELFKKIPSAPRLTLDDVFYGGRLPRGAGWNPPGYRYIVFKKGLPLYREVMIGQEPDESPKVRDIQYVADLKAPGNVGEMKPGSPQGQSGTTEHDEDNEPPTDKILWGEPAKGLKLGIQPLSFQPGSARLRQGEQLNCEVWIKNESGETIVIPRDPGWRFSAGLVDGRIDAAGASIFISFAVTQEFVDQGALMLEPGKQAKLFLTGTERATVKAAGAKPDKFGRKPFAVSPGTYPLDARCTVTFRLGTLDNKSSEQSVDLRSRAIELEILPAARLDGQTEKLVISSNSGFLLNEDHVISATAKPSENNTPYYSIHLQLNLAGAEIMSRDTQLMVQQTERNPNLRMVISFDDRVLLARKIISEIGEEIEISGRYTKAEAEKLAKKIGVCLRGAGLEFLAPYPQLRELFLGMTEQEFLQIAQRQNLALRKQVDRSYWIPTGDGYTVIIMFGNNGNKCSGIQRIRGG